MTAQRPLPPSAMFSSPLDLSLWDIDFSEDFFGEAEEGGMASVPSENAMMATENLDEEQGYDGLESRHPMMLEHVHSSNTMNDARRQISASSVDGSMMVYPKKKQESFFIAVSKELIPPQDIAQEIIATFLPESS